MPQASVSVNDAAKGLECGMQRRNSGVLGDLWTNSTLDMENNAGVRSQGSISSISTSYLTGDSQGGACSSTEPSEFVNHGESKLPDASRLLSEFTFKDLALLVTGLVLWKQTRQRWVRNKTSEARARHVREPILNQNMTYESLLGSKKPFPQPIPLAEMVQFLVEIWEQEGLYG